MNLHKRLSAISMHDRMLMVLIGLLFLGLIIGNVINYEHFLDSDMATNLMLARLCSDQNQIMASGWQYGTESRFINNQLVYALMFKFFSDWKIVRITGNLVIYVLLLLSFSFLMKQCGANRKYILLGMVLLLLPFSMGALTIIYISTDYVMPVIGMFVFISCYMSSVRALRFGIKRKQSIICIIVLTIISLLMGLCGLRYILLVIGPLFLLNFMEIWNHKKCDIYLKLDFITSIVVYFSFLCGFIYNKAVLQGQYGFDSYEGLSFLSWGKGVFLSNMEEICGAVLQALGYNNSVALTSVKGFLNIIVFGFVLTMVIVIVKLQKYLKCSWSQKKVLCFTLSAWIVNVFIYLFTEERLLVGRYFIPCIYMLIPLFCIYMQREDSIPSRWLVLIAAAVFFVTGAGRTYASWTVNSLNADKMGAVDYLETSGLTFGFATHWNAGVITELTSGEIEIANLYDVNEGIPMKQICPDYYYNAQYHPSDVFLLLTADEYNSFKDTEKARLGTVGYEDQNYIVLLYQSKTQICDYIVE